MLATIFSSRTKFLLLLIATTMSSRMVHGFVPIVFRGSVARFHSSTPLSAVVDDVTTAMKTAMKAKDTVTLNTIRLIRSAFVNSAIELRAETLTDDQAYTVLKKLAKMRKESIDMFERGGAVDRANDERAELKIIEQWLPVTVSDESLIRQWAQDAIAEAGPDNMGKVMGAFMKKHKADVDGGLAQTIIKDELAKLKQ